MHPDNAEAVDDLVERLRDTFARDHSYLLCAEAANAIEQKDKLIAELRGALAERQACIDELVSVNDLMKRYAAISVLEPGCERELLRDEHRQRDPRAWQRARALASSATKGETT